MRGALKWFWCKMRARSVTPGGLWLAFFAAICIGQGEGATGMLYLAAAFLFDVFAGDDT